jgi:hypothetical protein
MPPEHSNPSSLQASTVPSFPEINQQIFQDLHASGTAVTCRNSWPMEKSCPKGGLLDGPSGTVLGCEACPGARHPISLEVSLMH